MTDPLAHIGIPKVPAAQTASASQAGAGTNATAALSGDGVGGGAGLDFVSLIMARLQQSGALPSVAEGHSPSPALSANSLKARLAEIFSGTGQMQAPAEAAGDAELFQNGTASLFTGNTDGIQAGGIQTSKTPSGEPQAGLLNNTLLAQQVGLDPTNAGDAEIISALQDVFAELGLTLNVPNIEQPKIALNAQQISGDPLPQQQSFEPQSPAQDASAHLNTLTSPQDPAQNASPAQPPAMPDTSPSNAQIPAAPPPLADRTMRVAEAVTGEAFLLNQVITMSETGIAQSFINVEAAMQNAARTARAPTEQIAAAPGQKVAKPQTGNGNSPQIGVPQNTANGIAVKADGLPAQNAPPSSAHTSIAAHQVGGFDFAGGAEFLNQGGSNSFDAQLAQQLRGEHIQMNGDKSTAAMSQNSAAYRPGTPPPAQQIRAVLLNMTRGSGNAVERLSLQLEPADLGRVQIDLKMGDDGMLKAHILTDKSETLHMLQKDSTSLQKAFEDAGLDVGSESFSFDLRDQNDQQLARDKNSREALFGLSGIGGMDGIGSSAEDIINPAIYSGQYIRPTGINLYV